MCGKNNLRSGMSMPFVGSPPRVREKLTIEGKEALADRITPACAGKTYDWASVGWQVRDHPRVCGKNDTVLVRLVYTSGSPPRVREKQHHKLSVNQYHGITPACAGKTKE